MADASMMMNMDVVDDNEDFDDGITEVREGKAVIRCDKKLQIFYNAPQEVNRDIRYQIFQSCL